MIYKPHGYEVEYVHLCDVYQGEEIWGKLLLHIITPEIVPYYQLELKFKRGGFAGVRKVLGFYKWSRNVYHSYKETTNVRDLIPLIEKLSENKFITEKPDLTPILARAI